MPLPLTSVKTVSVYPGLRAPAGYLKIQACTVRIHARRSQALNGQRLEPMDQRHLLPRFYPRK